MPKLWHIVLFVCGIVSAQNTIVESIYFDFDKYSLNNTQTNTIISLIKKQESSRSESIQLYGYCDDRGTERYNNQLSKNRVTTVQEILIANGISQNKIFICEGRGKVDLDRNKLTNLNQTRDKNRRVEIHFVSNKTYSFFPTEPKVGDIIVLNRVSFEMGSSELSFLAKKELDKTAELLKKHKTVRFEIKGHVCCTSNKYKDAIDLESQKRNLSENRAKNVFNYLRTKGINPYRMTYKGYGNLFPLGQEEQQDRRVELSITKL